MYSQSSLKDSGDPIGTLSTVLPIFMHSFLKKNPAYCRVRNTEQNVVYKFDMSLKSWLE